MNDAWCSTRHSRAGLVSDVPRSEWRKGNYPAMSVATCSRDACVSKALRYVEKHAGVAADYYPDEVTA